HGHEDTAVAIDRIRRVAAEIGNPFARQRTDERFCELDLAVVGRVQLVTAGSVDGMRAERKTAGGRHRHHETQDFPTSPDDKFAPSDAIRSTLTTQRSSGLRERAPKRSAMFDGSLIDQT